VYYAFNYAKLDISCESGFHVRMFGLLMRSIVFSIRSNLFIFVQMTLECCLFVQNNLP
jgi:hypothetical protein